MPSLFCIISRVNVAVAVKACVNLEGTCLCRESWNEPDGQCGRDLTVGIKCNIPAFLAYYDASSAGLSEADPHLIFVSNRVNLSLLELHGRMASHGLTHLSVYMGLKLAIFVMLRVVQLRTEPKNFCLLWSATA